MQKPDKKKPNKPPEKLKEKPPKEEKQPVSEFVGKSVTV